MQTHDIHAQRARKIAFLMEARRTSQTYARIRQRAHALDIQAQVASGTYAPDCRYILIDYRDNNARLATRTMSVKSAAALNGRLAGTGFAWARVSAY